MKIEKMSCGQECPERSAECHATCRRYALRVAAAEIRKQRKRTIQDLESYDAIKYRETKRRVAVWRQKHQGKKV